MGKGRTRLPVETRGSLEQDAEVVHFLCKQQYISS